MVNLTGDKLMMGPEAQILVGGEIVKCPSGLCIKTNSAISDASASYALPFGFSVLGAAVWDRTYNRGIGQLYLSIDPTRKLLDRESDTQRQIPTDKLHFGADLPPEWQNNRVVTQGDIDNSVIGRVLWEADVAFKSRSLGFDVLTGVHPPASALPDITTNNESISGAEVSHESRWCRMYWSSGDQTISPDRTTGRIQLRGKPVVAHGEAMRVVSGKLQSYPQGEWCDDSKAVARSLQMTANSASATGTLRTLRDIAEMQNFWRWAKEHSVKVSNPVASEFGRLLKQDGHDSVPVWTSGVRSSQPVLVQYKRSIGFQDSQLLYVKYGDDSTVEKCVLPKWDKRRAELASVGVHPDAVGRFEGTDVFSKVDRWMNGFAASVATCAGGQVLPPKQERTTDTGDSEPSRGDFGVIPRRLPIDIHGGILLGKTPAALRDAVAQTGRLDDPAGKPVFQKNGQTLHFWSVLHTGQKDETVEHAEIQSASLIEAYPAEDSVNFLIQVSEDSLLRKELRKKHVEVLDRGVEWFGVYSAPDEPAYIEKAAWPCSPDAKDCVWVSDISRDDLRKYLSPNSETLGVDGSKADDSNRPNNKDIDADKDDSDTNSDLDEDDSEDELIQVARVSDNVWIVRVNKDRILEELNPDDTPDESDDGSELAATARMLSWWGFDEGRILADRFDALIAEKNGSVDYIAALLPPDQKSWELLMTTARIAEYSKKRFCTEIRRNMHFRRPFEER